MYSNRLQYRCHFIIYVKTGYAELSYIVERSKINKKLKNIFYKSCIK